MATLTWKTATGNKDIRKFESKVTYNGYISGAVTTATRFRMVVPCVARIKGIAMHANGTGSGTGSTQIDIRKNGTSIFVGTQRFNLLAADNGIFNAANVNPSARGVRPGDIIELAVTAIPTTTGHSDISFTIVLE